MVSDSQGRGYLNVINTTECDYALTIEPQALIDFSTDFSNFTDFCHIDSDNFTPDPRNRVQTTMVC